MNEFEGFESGDQPLDGGDIAGTYFHRGLIPGFKAFKFIHASIPSENCTEAAEIAEKRNQISIYSSQCSLRALC
jgi:hypothetical protein